MTTTVNRRASAVAQVHPAVFLAPVPDADLTTYEDREQLAGLYRLVDSDAAAPVFTTSPFPAALTSTSVQVDCTLTDDAEQGTFYVVVVADAAGAPSAAQIKAGTDSLNAPAPNGSDAFITSPASPSVTVAGLIAETAYDVYYVATDTFSNDTVVAKLDITTPAVSSTTLDVSQNLARSISQSIVEEL